MAHPKRFKKVANLYFVVFVGVFGVASPLLHAQADRAQGPVGTVVYLLGDVDVHRNGRFLDWDRVAIGLQIEDFDLVQTGTDGTARIEMSTPAARGALISVSEDTAFYFDIARMDAGNLTSIEMLAGSIGLQVQKTADHDTFVVHTPTMVMGVKGTEFEITTAPDGSCLVTCRSGEVVCEDDAGIRQYAHPGRVVEKTPEVFRSVALPVTELERYRSDWIAERERIFRAGAANIVRTAAQQYAVYEPQFIESLSGIIEKRDVFDAWINASRSGATIPEAELAAQRSSVTPSIAAVRSILPEYEQLYYRLKTLQRYHDQGIGRTTIRRGLTSAAFFATFSENSTAIETGLAMIRYYLKLYARMTGNENSAAFGEPASGDRIGDSGVPKTSNQRSYPKPVSR